MPNINDSNIVFSSSENISISSHCGSEDLPENDWSRKIFDQSQESVSKVNSLSSRSNEKNLITERIFNNGRSINEDYKVSVPVESQSISLFVGALQEIPTAIESAPNDFQQIMDLSNEDRLLCDNSHIKKMQKDLQAFDQLYLFEKNIYSIQLNKLNMIEREIKDYPSKNNFTIHNWEDPAESNSAKFYQENIKNELDLNEQEPQNIRCESLAINYQLLKIFSPELLDDDEIKIFQESEDSSNKPSSVIEINGISCFDSILEIVNS